MNHTPSQNITTEQLDDALKIMAKILELHGRKYLPLFIRIKEELDKSIENDIAYKEALKLALATT